ncbi:MAG TPA: transposase [Tichowtungia sp.]|nr:transposase [Tichowtungia sp.]
MPRKPRVEFAGATYHVMCRGNRQQPVFRDGRDNEIFLDTLEEACVRCGWRVHAFVLMGNHYHLLVETPEPNLVVGMQWLQGTYTKRFNVRHKEWGHLFQGRYKALLVDDGEYFSTVATYIHLNPARVRGYDYQAEQLEHYPWSSYPGYLWLRKKPEWLCVDRALSALNLADSPSGRRGYRAYIEKRLLEMSRSDQPWLIDGAWQKIRRGWCFGDEPFRKNMENRLDGVLASVKRESVSGEEVWRHDETEAERLVLQGMQALGLDEEHLPVLKKNCAEKYAIAWLVRRNTSVRPKWIKERLQMGKATNFAEFLKRMSAGEFGAECLRKVKNINS